jgi:hypothetical protein
MDNAELALPREKAAQIRDFVLALERHSARELAALIAG